MASRSPTLDELRRYAIARSLFKPLTLPGAIRKLGFVQADPMRAPARAQDLILRLRVRDYRAGDLERRYERLGIEEDAFVNYGFVSREMLALLHPRTPRRPWDAATTERAREVLAFVQERGMVHPREVSEAFAHHGRVAGYWGGELNASTRLLDAMHHHGWLRVCRRESGTRVYAPMEHPEQDTSPAARLARLEALVAEQSRRLNEQEALLARQTELLEAQSRRIDDRWRVADRFTETTALEQGGVGAPVALPGATVLGAEGLEAWRAGWDDHH